MTFHFDPTQHGFKKLDYPMQGGVVLYEMLQEGVDQTNHDHMRINVYLTQDRDYVTVWSGLIDAPMAQLSLGAVVPSDFRFTEQYELQLFRGYIEDNETGAVVLKALRLERYSPSALSINDMGALECRALRAV